MAFDVFPDPNTAATLGKPPFKPISLAAGETMRAFVKLPQHVGPDPTQPGVRATFVRIALWRKPPAPALTPGVEIVAMRSDFERLFAAGRRPRSVLFDRHRRSAFRFRQLH